MTIKVVRGNPTAEELAAALVVIHARTAPAGTGPVAPDAPGAWVDKTRTVLRSSVLRPGPGAWHATYRPC